jgi:hypothetical protein
VALLAIFLRVLFSYNLLSQHLERTKHVEMVCSLMPTSQDLPSEKTNL